MFNPKYNHSKEAAFFKTASLLLNWRTYSVTGTDYL